MAKIRNGFVTNSSSSSFILGFKNENEIRSVLEKEDCGDYFDTLYNDCVNAKKMNAKEMMEAIYEEIKDDAYFSVEEYSAQARSKSWKEILEWRKTKEFDDLVEKEILKETKEIEQEIQNNGYSVFVSVNYSDHGNAELEQKIAPNLECCIKRISYH